LETQKVCEATDTDALEELNLDLKTFLSWSPPPQCAVFILVSEHQKLTTANFGFFSLTVLARVRDIWAPPIGRRRLGAAVWALTVWATGHLGAGTNGHCRFGAGRFGARRYCDVCSSGTSVVVLYMSPKTVYLLTAQRITDVKKCCIKVFFYIFKLKERVFTILQFSNVF